VAFLFGPSAKARRLDSLGNRDAEVLVDRNQPIGGCGLLEVGALNGNVLAWDEMTQKGVLAKALCQRDAPSD
jgi:hypothetical protein